MHIHTLTRELISTAALPEAFAVFEDPYNLAKITPPWLNFRILTQGLRMKLGAEIDYEFRWLGVPLRWRTKITVYDPPFHFVDQALKSPYLHWRHSHTFMPVKDGTLISDLVDYALPGGIFGEAIHKLIVRKQLDQIFDYRQQKIKEILNG